MSKKNIVDGSAKTYDGMKEVAEGAWDLGKEAVKELQASLADLVPGSNETDVMYREYCDEDLSDLSNDLNDSINEIMDELPSEDGIVSGTFIVTVKHIAE